MNQETVSAGSPGGAGRHAFVTGATGFVGINLVRELRGQGWRVTALHRPSSSLKYLSGFGVEFAEGDVTDANSLLAATPEGLDAFFHVAGDTSQWAPERERQDRINIEGTRNAVAAALAKGAKRFIHTSTVSAYGQQDAPFDEDTPSNAPNSWINYERSKWLAEEEVRAGIAKGLDAVIIAPSAILGPYDTRSWAQLFPLIRDGKFNVLPPGRTQFNHVSEVVKAHVAAVDKGRSGASYILTGEEAGFADLVRIMAEVLGVPLKAKPISPGMLRFVGRLMGLIGRITGKRPDLTLEMATLVSGTLLYATDRAEKELGYKPVPLRKCIEDSHAWLKREGLI